MTHPADLVASKAFEAFIAQLPEAPPAPRTWDELAPRVKAAWIEAIRVALATAFELHTEGKL